MPANPILQRYIESCTTVEREYTHEPLRPRSGAVPPQLNGRLLRNGAGRLANQGVRYHHPFDGDGMITEFRFGDGAVHYTNRFVRTEEFVAEEEAGKPLYRSLGTNLPGGPLRNFGKIKVKNAANTSVIQHGGKLLALWEGGLPHELDPETLATVGRYDFAGRLRNDGDRIDRLINPEFAFSAHPKRHPDTGELHNFGVISGRNSRLALYRVSPTGDLTERRFLDIDELTFVHDFVLTAAGDRVFFLVAVSFDLLRTFVGIAPAIAAVRAKPDPTQILIVGPDGAVSQLETDNCFIFHYANGYRDPTGKIVADALRMEAFPEASGAARMMLNYEYEAAPAYLTRYVIDPAGGKVHAQSLSDYPMELPGINPDYETRAHRYVWAMGIDPERADQLLHGIVKVDTERRETTFHDFYPHLSGEPIMVPRAEGAEDEGFLLVVRHNDELQLSQLLIFDSQSLAEIAVLDLPHAIPVGFHGEWIS